MTCRPQITTKLRSAADWPQWLNQAQAVVKLLKLEEYVDLEGTKETKSITEPDKPEMPEYPEGEGVTRAQWEAYDRLMARYLAIQRVYERKKQQHDKLIEKHRELVATLQQSISDDVGLKKSSAAANQPTTLAMKVKELLRINDEITVQEFEDKWQQVLQRDLKKVSLGVWRDEVIKSTRAMRAWKSPLITKWRPHILIIENLAHYHPARAQWAQAFIDDSINAGTVPDFELFVIEVMDFIPKVGGGSSRSSKAISTTFQGLAKENPGQGKDQEKGRNRCKLCRRPGHQLDNCYTLRGYAQGTEPRLAEKKTRLERWLKDPRNREEAGKLYPQLSPVKEAPSPTSAVKSITVGAAQVGIKNPTRNSIIIGSGTDEHVFNDFERFIEFERFEQPIYALAGDSKLPVLGRGTARITVKGATGKPRIVHARNVHYSPDFHTNAISKSKWKDWGLVVCEWTNTVRFRHSRKVLCSFWEVAGMSVIEDGKPETEQAIVSKVVTKVGALQSAIKPIESTNKASI